jgi:hypothetical protein
MHAHDESVPLKLGSSLFWSLGQRLVVAVLVLLPIWGLLFWSIH